MFTTSLASGVFMLSGRMIQKDPGIIVGPVAKFLGLILNGIFNVVYSISPSNSLGFSIIFLTIFARFLMLPLAFGQQKSMMNMQKIQPEVEKIKKKYAGKDKETQQKMNVEIQKLYQENKVNPLSGCLPLVIQMPIFIALSYIMQQSYIYVNIIGDLYYKAEHSLAQVIIGAQSAIGYDKYAEVFKIVAAPKIPKNLLDAKVWDVAVPDILAQFINKFTQADWAVVLEVMPTGTKETLIGMIERKNEIELFFGIDLIQNPIVYSGGFDNIMRHLWPGILIPVFALITTFLSSWIMNKQSMATDENAKMQQRMMLIMMPIMMGGMTATFPSGVGLYWIISTVFQIGQQTILYKYFKNKREKEKEIIVKPETPKRDIKEKKSKKGGK